LIHHRTSVERSIFIQHPLIVARTPTANRRLWQRRRPAANGFRWWRSRHSRMQRPRSAGAAGICFQPGGAARFERIRRPYSPWRRVRPRGFGDLRTCCSQSAESPRHSPSPRSKQRGREEAGDKWSHSVPSTIRQWSWAASWNWPDKPVV
jgi:hypothetical protein